jgi:hypothetical protein
MNAQEEKKALLAQYTLTELPAYKLESEPVKESEVLDKSLILHLIVCTMTVTLSLFFYGRLILKCISYLNANNAANVHQNEAIGILAGSLVVAGVVLGLFLHAIVQTLRLCDAKKSRNIVISV